MSLGILQTRDLLVSLDPTTPLGQKIQFLRAQKFPTELDAFIQTLLSSPDENIFGRNKTIILQNINSLVTPPTVPSSLLGIQSELQYISGLKYPADRNILYLQYVPMFQTYVTPSDTFSNTLASVNSGISELQALTVPDLTTPPPMQFLQLAQPYRDFRAAYQLRPDKSQSQKTYLTIVQNALNGTNTPYTPFETFVSVMGFYGPSRDQTSNTFMVYLSEPTPGYAIAPGWNVLDLNGISGNVMITTFTANVYSDAVVSVGPPAVSFPFVSNAVAISDAPNVVTTGSSMMRLRLTPPSVAVSNATVTGGLSLYDPRVYDATLLTGNVVPLRDLSSNVTTTEGRNVYHTVVDRGSGTGALTALAAIGPQDPYIYGGQSFWIPEIKQHTAFVLTQRVSLPLSGNTYLGTTKQVDIFPRESGDLLSNMYLQFSLPALPAGTYYTELVGRAVIAKAEFLVDGIAYETITDDMYILNDQLFLDADEKLAMYQLVSNGTPEGSNVVATSAVSCIVPLDFFFCRRFSHRRKNKAPYFPLCAMTASTVSVRFTFNSNTWITNATTSVDLINPRLLIEEVTLTPAERLYYKSRKHRFKIPRRWNEAVQNFTNGVARVNLTANFPVSMMMWFIRNKRYEDEKTAAYYNSRYAYGYTTQYILAATPVTFFNGVTLRYIDTIDYATLYLNNNNVLSNFPGGLYYTFKQAVDHGLSVPTKNIYMYCFSERPTEYNQGGALDFTQLNAQTTHLDIKFLEQYAPQIQQEFSLNMFYYGYAVFEIDGGRARLLS